ncbi:hypothetical protein PRIPAC_93326 [Pristionchus pacificus]|uniref:Uncharacterized protein n=1 Tax=Pristionchus pacificus TaxID=54126 RepID=A0A2A6BAM9_PRIPA|nr:hypothetical protein PRIPAC_93326 [Pristionchus pacificus]|eukprot:PDM62924.1 hypothetical protein PRIPAC_50139 [Pristionchus pacificus]
MKETKVHKKKMPEITPPANFTVISHVDRRDTVDSLVNALQTPVVPLSSHGYFPESLPLPRKATGGSYASGAPSGGGTLGRGSAPRGQIPRTPLTPSLFSSSTSNLHRDTVSSGYGTWNAGAKGKIKRGMLSTADFLVPKSQAPQVPSPSSPSPQSDGRYLSAGARHARSVSASNDDVSLHTLGYVNVKPFGQPYIDPHATYTHAENDGYLKPYTVLKPNPPPHRPTSSSPKGRSSTVHVHQEIDVIFRPPREVAPPPPRDSHHETDSTTFIAAPDRITIQLARPTDLFGPGPGLGLGLGALGSGSGTIGIDDVVPLPCPGSLDSGVSEPPFPAPAPQPDPAPHKSISPEEVKEYLHKLRDYYSDLKDRDQLDSEGYILRENLLKPAAEQILADLQGMESHKKRPAPAPPVNGGASHASHAPLGASPAPCEDAVTPTASTRPVPKPRTTKPSSGASASSSGAATPVGDAAAAAPTFAAPAAPAALPEAAVQLNPATLKLAPAYSQLTKVLPSDDDDDEEMTRL